MSRTTPDSRAAAPTLIDVAKVAGVSPITVSRALGRPEVVSAATRRRVLEAVRATGYVPNLAAGALASSRSRLVAQTLPAPATLALGSPGYCRPAMPARWWYAAPTPSPRACWPKPAAAACACRTPGGDRLRRPVLRRAYPSTADHRTHRRTGTGAPAVVPGCGVRGDRAGEWVKARGGRGQSMVLSICARDAAGNLAVQSPIGGYLA
jgi:hypothetical protein